MQKGKQYTLLKVFKSSGFFRQLCKVWTNFNSEKKYHEKSEEEYDLSFIWLNKIFSVLNMGGGAYVFEKTQN